MDRWMNEQSGILGLSGRTNDMRELLQAADREQHGPSQLAIEVFCYRIKKYMGAYLAVLGGADAIVFGGGIGGVAPVIRRRICEGMECGAGYGWTPSATRQRSDFNKEMSPGSVRMDNHWKCMWELRRRKPGLPERQCAASERHNRS